MCQPDRHPTGSYVHDVFVQPEQLEAAPPDEVTTPWWSRMRSRFGWKAVRKSLTRAGLVLLGLKAVAMICLYLYLIVQAIVPAHPNVTRALVNPPMPEVDEGRRASGTEVAFDDFFERLNAGDVAKAHASLVEAIGEMKPDDRAAGLLQQYVAERRPLIPRDYLPFFEQTLPAFVTPAAPLNGSSYNVLIELDAHDTYHAAILFNGNIDPDFPSANDRKDKEKRRIELTGTYTSRFDWPVGLAIDRGSVLNAALQRWDGLIVVDVDGHLHLQNVEDLQYAFRRYDVRHRLADYRDFLELARRNRWSMVQTHLLVGDGRVLVAENGSPQKARRRALFQRADGGLAIYDSFGAEITLFDLATLLAHDYGATNAVNLDMGTYNYCAFYDRGQQTMDCGTARQGVVLSNVLSITY